MNGTAILIFATAAGGFFGAMCRYLMTRLLCYRRRISPSSALIIINCLGTFILGTVIGDIDHIKDDFEYTLLTTGFCASFTTFSSFARDLMDFFSKGAKWKMVRYWLVNLLLGICSLTYGMAAGELLSEMRF